MPPFEDDEVPTLKELHRTLRDFRDEFRVQMSMMVRKDVHSVEHDALNLRVNQLYDALSTRVNRLEAARESEEKTRATNRNQYYLAIFVGGLSLASTIFVALVK